MVKVSYKSFENNLLLVLFFFIICACSNDLDKIKKITYDPKSPDEVSKNLTIYHSESGYAKLNIFAQHAETYSEPPVTKLKDSVKIDFFDENGTISSTLTAKYGEIDHKTDKMYVKDSVKLTNHADQRTLYTSILYWMQADSSIYTDQNVRIESPKGIAYGTSLHAKQDFSYYKITDPKGIYEFE